MTKAPLLQKGTLISASAVPGGGKGRGGGVAWGWEWGLEGSWRKQSVKVGWGYPCDGCILLSTG